jgi:hypothetical protein
MSASRRIGLRQGFLLATLVLVPLGGVVAASCGDDSSSSGPADSRGTSPDDTGDGTEGAVALPEACDETVPCGGSVVGTWEQVDTTCSFDVITGKNEEGCFEFTSDPRDVTRSGSLTFTEQGTVTGKIVYRSITKRKYDAACVTTKEGSASFGEFCTNSSFEQESTVPEGATEGVFTGNGSVASQSCTLSGDNCTCALDSTVVYNFDNAEYAASADGETLWLWKAEENTLGSYCVFGDTLTVMVSGRPYLVWKRAP